MFRYTGRLSEQVVVQVVPIMFYAIHLWP